MVTSSCRSTVTSSCSIGIGILVCDMSLCPLNLSFYESRNTYLCSDFNFCGRNLSIITCLAHLPALFGHAISTRCRRIIFKNVKRSFTSVETLVANFRIRLFVALAYFVPHISAAQILVKSFVGLYNFIHLSVPP